MTDKKKNQPSVERQKELLRDLATRTSEQSIKVSDVLANVVKTYSATIAKFGFEEGLLREIATEYLLPFFSGARLEPNSIPSNAIESTVALTSRDTIAFKVNKRDTYRLVFRRDQPFAPAGNAARELNVIEAFVAILSQMNAELKGHLKNDLLSTFPRRVVARAAVDDVEKEEQLLAVIDQMATWSSRLYEGGAITGAIGIDPTVSGDIDLPLGLIAESDFGAVLSNGFNTLITVDESLNFVDHKTILPSDVPSSFCPWQHSSIADWTRDAQGRVAIVLNRLGEILVIRDGQLLFARRNGIWHFLTHEPVTNQMRVPRYKAIRKAIYETALDCSFGRTGACIGVVSASSGAKWKKVVADGDKIELAHTAKSKAINKILSGKKFHELDRNIRKELAAIDGATVINHEGEVLAVGAIVKIDGGSAGGGRTAAANSLAKLGLGLKVSQDGAITAWHPKSAKSTQTTIAFRLM